MAYESRLRRARERTFPTWSVVRLTSSIDLAHSFGPAYLRGLLQQGQRGLAVLGVNVQETQATVDGARSTGILWLDACRQVQAERRVVEGLVMVVPTGTAVEIGDHGNPATRSVHAIDKRMPQERFAESIACMPFCRNARPWFSRPR